MRPVLKRVFEVKPSDILVADNGTFLVANENLDFITANGKVGITYATFKMLCLETKLYRLCVV